MKCVWDWFNVPHRNVLPISQEHLLKEYEISLKRLETKRMGWYMGLQEVMLTVSMISDFFFTSVYFLAWRHHARPYYFSVKWCGRLSRRRGIELDSKNVSLCWTRRLLWTVNFRQSLLAWTSTLFVPCVSKRLYMEKAFRYS